MSDAYREVPPLTGHAARKAQHWLDKAVEVARHARCLRSRCGSVIVSDGEIIGSGVNSPPGGCTPLACIKDRLSTGFRSDRTCCTHAEQGAIYDALRNAPYWLVGADLYFVRLDAAGQFIPAQEPYCTICSKAALEVGIARFVLSHDDGIRAYSTGCYNRLSFGLEVR